jgi:hypothetical protein
MTQSFLASTSWRTMHSKHTARCKTCINIIFKSIFWCISPTKWTHISTQQSLKVPEFLKRFSTTLLMIRFMIILLCNIVSFYIRVIWRAWGLGQYWLWFGMTDVLQNSNVHIVVRLYVVHCMSWKYFASGHGKEEIDNASALLKHEICKEQIKP